ncbi:MAG: flagellar motor protein MotB [Spirochaetota bacterium]|nr:MAG: flagellar motor protein MotB [Spirochaetota bacterium]
MKKLVSVILAPLVLLFLISGCVSSKRYKQLEQAHEHLKEGYNAAMRELDALDEEIESLRQAIEKEATATEQEMKRIEETYTALVKNLSEEISEGKVEVERIKGKLQLSIAEEIFFDSGSAELKVEGEELLKRIGAILKEIPEKNIRIEGHTDNVKIGRSLREKYPTNWELGAIRAVNVVRYLQEEAGVDPLRLSAVSFAQYRPVDTNKTKAGKAKNRRIEIVFVDRDLDLVKKMRENL